ARTARRFGTARSVAVSRLWESQPLRMLNPLTSLLASQAVKRSWCATLAVLAAVRVAVPLVDWATGLPGVPRFHYHGLQGDATGFYAAAREFIAAWGRVPRVGLVLLAVAAAAAAAGIVLRWRRRPAERPWLLALAVLV